MSWISDIFSSSASSIVDSVGTAIDKLVTSDEERLALQNELVKIKLDADSRTQEVDLHINPSVVVTIPQEVSMAQFRAALIISGLKTTVDNAVAASGDELLINDYEYRTTTRRDWASFITMAIALGKTDAEIDDLFLLASTL